MPAEPVTELDQRYSASTARATPWAEGRMRLDEAELYWLTTIRPEGRPHVTPLIAVWLDDAVFFCTGEAEQKARNLAKNPRCSLITGSNELGTGLDIVIEAEATRERDHARLERVADAYRSKYGSEWSFDVREGAFVGSQGNVAIVFELAPVTGYGFGKGTYSQTRWRFEAGAPVSP
jgi:hypothetical protein